MTRGSVQTALQKHCRIPIYSQNKFESLASHTSTDPINPPSELLKESIMAGTITPTPYPQKMQDSILDPCTNKEN